MTTPVSEKQVTVPSQGGPVEPPAPVIDHVRAHSFRCYWDFTDCCWVCSSE